MFNKRQPRINPFATQITVVSKQEQNETIEQEAGENEDNPEEVVIKPKKSRYLPAERLLKKLNKQKHKSLYQKVTTVKNRNNKKNISQLHHGKKNNLKLSELNHITERLASIIHNGII